MSGEQAARKVALWRRPWLRITTAIIVGLIVYGTVTSLYDVEGKLDQQGSSVASATSGLIAVITPLSVNPASNTAVMRIKFMAPGEDLLDDTGRLAKNTRVTVISSEGAIERTYGAGSVPAPLEVPVGVAGEQAQYPFDSHSGTFGIVVDTYETVDGVIHSTGTVPLAAIGDEGVSGWNTTMDFDAADDDADVVEIGFTRAFSTQAFAVLILCAAAALATLGLVIGVLVKTQRRRIEATMLSWGAALLFALPAMRNFMPNSPPIGVAIDIYVYLWVMLAAVTGAVLLAVAWIERDRAPREAGTDAA